MQYEQKTIAQLQYDEMSITQLENAVRKALKRFKCGIIEAAKLLRYLQRTNRYKENARYAKEPFKVYLDDQFGVRMGTYMEWVKALPYEKEAETFGVGLVSKTVSTCGKKGAERAFAEISALEEVKKKSVPREKIEEIIEKHTDPKRKEAAKKERNDWRAMYVTERAAHLATKAELQKAQKTIIEQAEQIRKLTKNGEIMLEVKRIMNESKDCEPELK